MSKLDDFKNGARFNIRILDECSSPGCKDDAKQLVTGSAKRTAFSADAVPVLEAAGISFIRGVRGGFASINAAILDRIRSLDSPDAGGFCRAAEYAVSSRARSAYCWKLAGGRFLDIEGRPRLMGILNVTPDSFSDGGLYQSTSSALEHAELMLEQGAEIIDVGGESTRPGAGTVSAAEEIDRVVPVVDELIRRTNVAVSIDTTKADVAKAALDAGACIINDISGLSFDPEMARLAAEREAGLVIMHIRGTPRDMQTNPSYSDTVAEVSMELRQCVLTALDAGVLPERIVIDPGIGFGKRAEDNLRLLGSVGELRSLGFPLLLGCSRKSFLGEITGSGARQRVIETTASSAMAAMYGVSVLRVHDVAENKACLDIVQAVLESMK